MGTLCKNAPGRIVNSETLDVKIISYCLLLFFIEVSALEQIYRYRLAAYTTPFKLLHPTTLKIYKSSHVLRFTSYFIVNYLLLFFIVLVIPHLMRYP